MEAGQKWYILEIHQMYILFAPLRRIQTKTLLLPVMEVQLRIIKHKLWAKVYRWVICQPQLILQDNWKLIILGERWDRELMQLSAFAWIKETNWNMLWRFMKNTNYQTPWKGKLHRERLLYLKDSSIPALSGCMTWLIHLNKYSLSQITLREFLSSNILNRYQTESWERPLLVEFSSR